MGSRWQLVVGLALLALGLAVVAAGTIHPSADPFVALGLLLIVPSFVSLCGAVVIVVGLARRAESTTRSARVVRIVVLPAILTLGLALGFGVAGTLSQIPDSVAGLNGPFVPGPAAGISELAVGGIGLLTGLIIGAVVAIVWWMRRGRRLPPRSVDAPRRVRPRRGTGDGTATGGLAN